MPDAPPAARRLVDPIHIVDVFVYVVVLNLAVEYVPVVLTETFTLSLLTAVLLKAVLEVVVRGKTWLIGRIRTASTTPRRVVSIGMLVLLLPASKLLVLELVALVFGDSVHLGGFWSVTALIVVLMLSRLAVRWLLR